MTKRHADYADRIDIMSCSLDAIADPEISVAPIRQIFRQMLDTDHPMEKDLADRPPSTGVANLRPRAKKSCHFWKNDRPLSPSVHRLKNPGARVPRGLRQGLAAPSPFSAPPRPLRPRAGSHRGLRLEAAALEEVRPTRCDRLRCRKANHCRDTCDGDGP